MKNCMDCALTNPNLTGHVEQDTGVATTNTIWCLHKEAWVYQYMFGNQPCFKAKTAKCRSCGDKGFHYDHRYDQHYFACRQDLTCCARGPNRPTEDEARDAWNLLNTPNETP